MFIISIKETTFFLQKTRFTIIHYISIDLLLIWQTILLVFFTVKAVNQCCGC